jgi:alpha-beta hydrolase superfamily lysophospholipase
MRSTHCIRALLAVAVAGILAGPSPAGAQQPDAAASTLSVFLQGVPVGSELSSVTRTAGGWTIVSSGRLNAPLDVVTRRMEIRYDADWKARELTIDAVVRGLPFAAHTTVDGTSFKTDVTNSGAAPTTVTATSNAEVLLPNLFFSAFEAVSAKLRTAAAGATIPVYVVAQATVAILVGESTNEQIQTAKRLIQTRHTHFTIQQSMPLEVDTWADENGRLLRLSIPAQSLEVVRDDVASVAARQVPVSRPNDEQVRIPSNGFSLAGTISKPLTAATGPRPAVVLVGGSGPTDRDEVIFNVPVLGQIANALADAGFITLRYDKRGIGQSGGRPESAALIDYMDDLRAAVKLLADRKDVDARRIAVIGHSEGGAVALMAAAKDKRIAAVGLIGANGVTGAELVLQQQQHLLDRLTLSDAEKQQKVALQKRMMDAVITGTGWEQFSPQDRRQVDNPEFQSVLTNDPAKIMPDVRQPILIVQAELDTQVAPSNADRLAELARMRKNSPAVQVARIPGINHLLVPAATGEVEEYGSLKDRTVSPAVSSAIATWLTTTFAAIR